MPRIKHRQPQKGVGDKPCPRRSSERRDGLEEVVLHLFAASYVRPLGPLLLALRHDALELGFIVAQVKAHIDLFGIGRITANEVERLEVLGGEFKLPLCFGVGLACSRVQLGTVLDSVIQQGKYSSKYETRVAIRRTFSIYSLSE